MKKTILMLVALAFGVGGFAQGVGSIFTQGATKIKYYAEQIAALQLYISKAEKDYKILESGLQDIQQIKQGDFNLHSAFFASLEAVNPNVSGMAQVAEIIALQISIVNQFSGSIKRWQSGSNLNSGELGVVGAVYTNVCNDGIADINALMTLITANQVKMTDAQRMHGIQLLDDEMKDQYSFTMDFTNRTDLLAQQRQAGQADAGNVKAWYGLP
jgi:hypothetical protein